MIEIHALCKRFGAEVVVSDLHLTVARGELLVLLGGSGSGKTTTLKMVNRLVEPSSGTVRIGGRDTAQVPGPLLRRNIGYCFQQVGLFPHLSVAENVGVVPQLLGWPPERVRTRVDALLARFELDPATFRDRPPDALSGGQAQRVGLARALAGEPEVMLLDEPFAALDPPTRDRLQQHFLALRRELGLTAIFVTHDVVEALLLADRIAVLHEGRLAQVGTPDALLRDPANDAVAALMETPRRQAAAIRHFLEGAE